MVSIIDTHAHLDGKEFDQDREAVIGRAAEAGVKTIFLPAIDLVTSRRIVELCRKDASPVDNNHESTDKVKLFPMVGLHPEEVRTDWREQLSAIHELLEQQLAAEKQGTTGSPVIAIGEVGLDYYWSREYEQEQIEAFEEQVKWSVATRLPLMIHCRKAQNEMVSLLRRYKDELPGGVFHCFTGNAIEARELLQFDRFVLGIGGVLTFKKSHLPETLAQAVPLSRVVVETDSPYMAPVPMRGQRNEPSFTRYVVQRMAEAYGVSEDEVARHTNANAHRVFGL